MFSIPDAVITGAGAAIALTTAIVPPQPKHFYGGVLFDETARDALRLPTSKGRFVARDASDVVLSLEATWPFFVDAVITAWGWRGSPDAALQMALVDAQALAIVTAVQGVTNTIASRERPYGRDCGTEIPARNIDCESSSRYRSFFSGHAAFAFTSAGLVCVHHVKLNLLDSRTADIAACVVAYVGASATATLRTMADVHYASDVLVGALFGTVVGLAVPLWHHRRRDATPEESPNARLQVTPVGLGLGLSGTF